MIGNIDYVIDIVAEREGYDKEVLKKITMGYFKEWKKQMRYGEEILIPFGRFGDFMIMNSKLRGYVRRLIKKIRTIRIRRFQGKSKMPYNQLLAIEHKYMEEFRLAWRQLEVIRKILTERNKYYKEYFKTYEKRKPVEDTTYDIK